MITIVVTFKIQFKLLFLKKIIVKTYMEIIIMLSNGNVPTNIYLITLRSNGES